MAADVFYLVGFAGFMFVSRVRGIRAGKIPLKYFKVYAGDGPSERMELIAQHYENQFEVPMLFLITCVLFIALDAESPITLTLAWVFVISRGIHAWIHLGRNQVQKRAIAFVIGWFCLLGLWLQLTLLALN